jgi:phosphoribosylformylglycinamidine (FGAM) synthase PurS component
MKYLDQEAKALQSKLGQLYHMKAEHNRTTGVANLGLDREIKETEKDLEFILKQLEKSLCHK